VILAAPNYVENVLRLRDDQNKLLRKRQFFTSRLWLIVLIARSFTLNISKDRYASKFPERMVFRWRRRANSRHAPPLATLEVVIRQNTPLN